MKDTVSLPVLTELSNAAPLTPERELLIAVLERTVLDYYSNNILVRAEAEEWLFGESDSADLFSLEWLSGHLSIAPGALRRRIMQLELQTNGPSQAHRWIRSKVQSRKAYPQPMEQMFATSA